jgi:hypothetical protein
MCRISLVTSIVVGLATAELPAQERKSRDQLVLEDLDNVRASDQWIYNDVEKGLAAATGSNRPLLVVFRCIPCEACAQLDASIVEGDARVQDLLKQYVCVRVVHANGLDLNLFQFDYDQSFAAFIMNGDKTVYGRFGTRSHRTRSEDDVSIEGFAEALEAGLKIHAAYPGNRAELVGKQPQTRPPYATPEQFPQLNKYASKLDYNGKVAASCIHCHQVGEAQWSVRRDKGEAISTQVLFPYPHPKILGLIMDPKECATLAEVAEDSPASRAGFAAGDKLEMIAGQSVLSMADMQWALQHSPDHGAVEVAVERKGQPLKLSLTLEPGWRSRGDISWRASSWGLRRMTTGGLLLEEAPPAMRKELELDDASMALRVKYMGPNTLAKRQGFQVDDVIVSVDGDSKRQREADLLVKLIQKPVGQRVNFKVIRGLQNIELSLVTQK